MDHHSKILHSSRGMQTVQCRQECVDNFPGNHCYLDENNIGCVLGQKIQQWEGLPHPQTQCCRVDTDHAFVRTARDILTFANQKNDSGTQQRRDALSNLLHSIGANAHGINPQAQSTFVGDTLLLRNTHLDADRKSELLTLLDAIVPVSGYRVLCHVPDLLEQPESRRFRGNITYRILPDEPFPNMMNLAYKMDIFLARPIHSPTVVRLLQDVRARPGNAHINLLISSIAGPTISEEQIDQIWESVTRSQFRGKIIFGCRNAPMLQNIGLVRTYVSGTRRLEVKPAALVIEVD